MPAEIRPTRLITTLTFLAIAALLSSAAPAQAGYFVTYDLAGSEVSITDSPFYALDLVEPVGPGTMVLEFDGADVRIVDFELDAAFSKTSGLATVSWDLDIELGRADDGIVGEAYGTAAGNEIVWDGLATNWSSSGSILCEASIGFCSLGGMIPNVPEVEDRLLDVELGTFVFDGAGTGFTAGPVSYLLTDDNRTLATISYTLVGREISRGPMPSIPEPSAALLFALGALAIRRSVARRHQKKSDQPLFSS